MKKIVIRAAIVISVLLLIFKGFLIYRNYTSYSNVIHKDADNIVKINVDGIITSIVYNAIKNPNYYSKARKKDKDSIEDKDSRRNGFGIPANIFLYTIRGKSASTIFTSFKISDANDFKAHLKNEYNINDFQSIKSITVAKNKDGKIQIAFDEKQCVIVYNPSKEVVDNIFTDLLINGKTLNSDNALFSKLKDAEAHIAFVSYNDEGFINFNDGSIDIAGQMILPEHIKSPTKSILPQFSKESSVRFYLNALPSKKYETTRFKNFSIELDSITNYYKGNFSLEIAGSTPQQDSIVTYEYNDDFEKIETFTVSKKQVPEINIQMSAKPKELLNYFESTSIINNGMFNKALFPLYQFKIDTTATGLQASTNLTKTIVVNKSSYPECFALDINFEKLKKQNQFPILTPFLENLSYLKLKGHISTKDKLQIEGRVQLKNEAINAIAQLIFQDK